MHIIDHLVRTNLNKKTCSIFWHQSLNSLGCNLITFWCYPWLLHGLKLHCSMSPFHGWWNAMFIRKCPEPDLLLDFREMSNLPFYPFNFCKKIFIQWLKEMGIFWFSILSYFSPRTDSTFHLENINQLFSKYL